MPPKPRPTRLDKALQERMYFISHIPPSATSRSHNILVTGQSGNLYTVTLPTTPSLTAKCNCMDQRIRRSLCKHMLFTLLRVLKLPHAALPTTDHNAIPDLTTTLLPAIQKSLTGLRCAEVEAPDQVRGVVRALAPGVLGVRAEVQRRPVKAGDECPICFDDLPGEEVVFCGYGCGNGVHAACFERYARATDGPARCVLCRTIWERGAEAEIGKQGLLVGRRLVNVAEVVPHAFDGAAVGRLGLDRNGPEREPRKGCAGGSGGRGSGGRGRGKAAGVKERIKKTGPSDREKRARAREQRKRVAERKRSGKGSGKGVDGRASGMRTRSRRAAGA